MDHLSVARGFTQDPQLRRPPLPRTPLKPRPWHPTYLRADSPLLHSDVRARRTTPSEESSTWRTIWMVS
jgi:hypothetical protein